MGLLEMFCRGDNAENGKGIVVDEERTEGWSLRFLREFFLDQFEVRLSDKRFGEGHFHEGAG